MIATISKWLEHLVERSASLKRYAIGVLILLVIANVLAPSAYQRFPWDGIPGFGAFYGFVSCVLIIVVSKALGYAFLYRKEDYYDE